MSAVNLTMEGFLAKDPEIRYSATGKMMAQISMAHNPGKKEENKPPIWFNFKVVGAAAEKFANAKKGTKAKVTRAAPEEWTDRDGNKRLSWVVFGADVDGAEKAEAKEEDIPPFFDDPDSIPF